MYNVETKIVKGYKEIDVPYTLLSKGGGSTKLAIILPGAGYTAQAPLLHYSTGVFVNKSYDVLQVNYQYNSKVYEDYTIEEISQAIKLDVKTVIDDVLMNKSYENLILIGKSLGTIAMSSELNRENLKGAKAIWMTPLIQREEVLQAIINSKNKGLCIIGSEDHCYTEERFANVLENRNITTKLIPGVNHSLEYDEKAVESIDVLKSVINDIDQFSNG
ncbi:alpha/beta hydrolase [Bacillus shivajii]|uniref:alpha/beta family hydrolase n=1 Tax=Bacillus shivajii TaxID=1983719 RepID=UPI001CF9BE30|nr:alpha/beta family hydrolase [Bacillus shivajii]UCZ54961.1 alpha/beta hydrolase [Bacillus shivajii]